MSTETSVSFRERTGNRHAVKRTVGSLLDIAATLAPLVVLGTIGTRLRADTALGAVLINLAYVLCIAVASIVLKLRGTSWREIGLGRPKSWLRTALLGIAALVGAIVVMNVPVAIALNLAGAATAPPDISRFSPLAGNLPLMLLYVALAWTTIAFGEEMLFRAFLTSWLGRVFQHPRLGWALAVIGSGLAFGLAHFQEGPMGIVSNGAFGLLFGAIYVVTQRNLWVTIIAHGLLNTLRFVLMFAGAAQGR